MVLDLRQQDLPRKKRTFYQCSDCLDHGALSRKQFLAPVIFPLILICRMVSCGCDGSLLELPAFVRYHGTAGCGHVMLGSHECTSRSDLISFLRLSLSEACRFIRRGPSVCPRIDAQAALARPLVRRVIGTG